MAQERESDQEPKTGQQDETDTTRVTTEISTPPKSDESADDTERN